MKKIKFLCIVIAIFLVMGCATTTFCYVKVNTIGQHEVNQTYYLAPGDTNTNINDLYFVEYAGYIEKALNSKNYKRIAKFDTADVLVLLFYGISDPKNNIYTYSVPVFGQTGIASSTTTGSISSYGRFNSTTTYRPTYGITGSNTYTGQYTTYDRHIDIIAMDLKRYRETKEEVQLWKTSIISTGTTGDLRDVFPIMIAATKIYIGNDTRKAIDLSIDITDPSIEAIKGK